MDDPRYLRRLHPSLVKLADRVPRLKSSLNIIILFYAKKEIDVLAKAFIFELASSS